MSQFDQILFANSTHALLMIPCKNTLQEKEDDFYATVKVICFKA